MEILKKIRPSPEQKREFEDQINKIIKKLNKQLTKIDAKAVIGGSAAKGTYLKQEHDIDIYIKFNYLKYNKRSKELSNILEKNLLFLFPEFKRIHGSRDYFQIFKKDYTFEIIPILDIKTQEQAKNITDLSPLHVSWVKSKLNSKLADEIRLAKAYTKALNIYGAESYIKGFSGYVLEILIIYYRSFNNLINNAKKWKPRQIIDIEKHYKTKNELLNKIKQKDCPLIIVDPVQKQRNAAAAVSTETFTKFINACKHYSPEQFKKQKINIPKLKKLAKKTNTNLTILKITTTQGKEDIIGSRLLKLLEYIKNSIELEDFHIYKYGWEWDKKGKALFWFLSHKETLPKYKKHYGPPIWEHEHYKKFLKKWKNYEIQSEHNRIFIEIPRKYITLKNFLKNLTRRIKRKDIISITL